jgi:hypothetical protein
MTRVHTLQSGFVTKDSSRLIRNEEEKLNIQDSLYRPDYRTSDTENYYDEGVEALFKQWRDDNAIMSRFEFREALIKTALRVFGSVSIIPWLSVQLTSPSVRYLHRKFLSETMASVLNKEPRTLDAYQYYRLLTVYKDTQFTAMNDKDVDKALKEYIKNASSSSVDMVCSWTKDVHGLCDMLNTLHVIFGRRHGFVDVGTRSE